MTTKKLALIITIAIVAVALLSTAVVFASTRSDDGNVRLVPEASETTPSETLETIPATIPDETTPETTETEESDVPEETEGTTSNATTATTPSTAPNYNPTKNISGEADVVENNDAPVVTVVVEKEDTTHYEDEEVSAVVIPTVITPNTTFGVEETTHSTTPTTDNTVRTDIVNSPAMDDNTVEEEVVGVELEEVEEDEMPDFLP